MGYKVPEAMPQRWCTSAPDNCTVGFSKKASNTRSVCSDIRTGVSFLPIVASLHRVYDECKLTAVVAQTLADLQHRGLKKIGFVNNDFF